ncbi:MAG: helix-turn-helix domain-containing protein [Candidatus Acidiferrales bacterium]
MNPEELFGQRVRAARKAARLTLERAAEKLDIHANHLAQIERGTKRPSFELVFALANAFSVSPVTFFLFERDEKDEKILRRKINALLDRYTAEQLGQTYRYMKFMIGP